MPKINKDFSDALGFRLLSVYQSFVNEYPVEGAKIQKLYDEGFKETCYKCYPIIAEAGIDPSFYEPKAQQAGDIKIELRKMFPIKKVAKSPTPETIDLTDDEDTSKTVVKKPSPKREPVSLPRPSPLRPASPLKCANCEKLRQKVLDLEVANNKVLDLEAANNKVMKLNKEQAEVIARLNEQIKQLNSIVSSKNSIIVKHQQTISDLQIAKNMNLRTISALEKENYKMVGLVKQCQATVNDLDLQIEASKKRKQ